MTIDKYWSPDCDPPYFSVLRRWFFTLTSLFKHKDKKTRCSRTAVFLIQPIYKESHWDKLNRFVQWISSRRPPGFLQLLQDSSASPHPTFSHLHCVDWRHFTSHVISGVEWSPTALWRLVANLPQGHEGSSSLSLYTVCSKPRPGFYPNVISLIITVFPLLYRGSPFSSSVHGRFCFFNPISL